MFSLSKGVPSDYTGLMEQMVWPWWQCPEVGSQLPNFVQSHRTDVWCSQGFSAESTSVYYVYFPTQPRISNTNYMRMRHRCITPSTQPVLETLKKQKIVKICNYHTHIWTGILLSLWPMQKKVVECTTATLHSMVYLENTLNSAKSA